MRSTLIWSTTPLSKIFSSFCTKSKLRSSITPDTYVRPSHNVKGLSVAVFFTLRDLSHFVRKSSALLARAAMPGEKASNKKWPLSLYKNSQS